MFRQILATIIVIIFVSYNVSHSDEIRAVGTHPAEMDTCIEAYGKAGKTICAVAFTAKGGWVVACDDGTINAGGPRPEKMDKLIIDHGKAGRVVSVVAFTDRGGWVVSCTDGVTNAGGPAGSRPPAMDKLIQDHEKPGKTIDLVALGDNGAWIVGTTDGDIMGHGKKPKDLDKEFMERGKAGFKVTVAAFIAKGWVLGWRPK